MGRWTYIRTGHDFVAEDFAPFLEALVAGEHRRRVLVAAAHELEEKHRSGTADWEISDFVDDQKTGEYERS